VNLVESGSGLSDTKTSDTIFNPEQQLAITSFPQSVTSLCYFYPRLCLKPEEAQFVRLADGNGKHLLLISHVDGRSAHPQQEPALWRAIRRTLEKKE